MRGVWRVAVIALLWAVPVAAVALVFPLVEQRGRESAEVEPPSVVTVGSRLIDNATSVQVVVSHGNPVVATSPMAGTVTTLRDPGPVEIGDVLFTVDGAPVLAYDGYPIFRDLSHGDRGEDVEALAHFLVELDLLDEQAADDYFGDQVRAAVRALQDELGLRVDGVFRTSYVTRMQPELNPVVEQLADQGDAIDPGTPVLQGARPVAGVTIEEQQGEALNGVEGEPLVLRFVSEELELADVRPTGEQAVALADELAALAEDGAIRIDDGFGGLGGGVSSDEQTTSYAGGIVALAEPVERGVVPATAVRTEASGASCLMSGDADDPDGAQPIPLDVLEVGNELGTALVDVSLAGTEVLRDAGTGGCGP